MIFTPHNTMGNKIKVYDPSGTEIPHVITYNTRTREMTMFLTGLRDDKSYPLVKSKKTVNGQAFYRQLIKVKLTVPGSYIIIDGKRF